jgi:Ca-activated chloride channel family protein
MDVSHAIDHPTISGNTPQRVHLLLRLETWPEEGGAVRKPLNVAVALDRSLSMHGPKLEAAKQAVLALAGRLGPGDLLSVVAFESGAEVAVPPVDSRAL